MAGWSSDLLGEKWQKTESTTIRNLYEAWWFVTGLRFQTSQLVPERWHHRLRGRPRLRVGTAHHNEGGGGQPVLRPQWLCSFRARDASQVIARDVSGRRSNHSSIHHLGAQQQQRCRRPCWNHRHSKRRRWTSLTDGRLGEIRLQQMAWRRRRS